MSDSLTRDVGGGTHKLERVNRIAVSRHEKLDIGGRGTHELERVKRMAVSRSEILKVGGRGDSQAGESEEDGSWQK